ncbi:Na/Pi symporter [Kroppenstedtia eburnea]|uniref:Phosphate:Na+ symporter n=1 Tax=Kroppenstedtia eburnea TaxID=714067 RepID=A0A1N7KZL0_9BACL|nr:Na/Pi symporter [Kroppenstedtia eburnea]EGK12647.1 PnaS family phosphate:sodium (Na+) symporter [Desmospora sp. 8437]QKI82735.1 Na/Pi cotransporter family protein [Kroppenstedtia eburnea]SIS66946.1 phosphate:Na+ symporter [Kroppenstedtia eburnea]
MKEIVIPFATGLAIFLFGMQLIRVGLEELTAHRMQHFLLRFTKTPLRGFGTGLVATLFLQSSSAVTVLTIGFVNAGLLTFAQTVGIILGTNVGTTVTTEILALKVEDFALPLILTGAALYALPWKKTAAFGLALGGFGCIFLGMEAMQWIAEPIKNRGWVAALMESGYHPVFSGVLSGILLTSIIQSGNAVIAITMGFFATGLVPLPFAIAVVLGSNVGTCITAFLASIGTERAAKQVALAHLLLNVGGLLLFLPWVGTIAEVAHWLSDDPAAQIAHIQTLYNLICSLTVLPFASSFARVVSRILPERNPSWSFRGRHPHPLLKWHQ